MSLPNSPEQVVKADGVSPSRQGPVILGFAFVRMDHPRSARGGRMKRGGDRALLAPKDLT